MDESPVANQSADKAICCVITVIFIVGVLGNASAFMYFWPNRHRGIPNKLYLAIVSVDICTSFLTIPTIISLFSNREPMLFAISSLCGGWAIVSLFLLRMSMFLVTIMSITRTIAIVRPFDEVNLSPIMIAITVYAAVLLTENAVYFTLGWLRGMYLMRQSYCSYHLTGRAHSWAKMTLFITFQIEVILPSVMVFISFIVSFVSLIRNRNTVVSSASEKASRKVSVTIALFTAVFLVCNIPIFVFQLLFMITFFNPSLYSKINSETTAMYGHLMFLYFPYILNAALNPLVYFFRMPQYKEKIAHIWNQR